MSSIAAVPLRFLPQANTGGYEENASAESVRLMPDLLAAPWYKWRFQPHAINAFATRCDRIGRSV